MKQPAFPTGTNYGMDLRDYFAAHAPLEPQAWFKPNYENSGVYFRFESITKIRNSDMSENEKTKAIEDQQEMRNKYNELKLKQWPYAWADAMMEARTK